MRLSTAEDVAALDFAKGAGLLPAIVQHAASGAVLMLGYLTREALEETLRRERVVFFSRSKGRLWEKGETSGHALELIALHADCDRDAVLITALPRGPVCHLGTASCFDPQPQGAPAGFLGELERVIAARLAARPSGSYTARLAAAGPTRAAQKLGEEAVEVALAGAAGDDAALIAESADLLYHLLLLLGLRGVPLAAVTAELAARHAARG
jgi:phosphoribosyl-AMP cyclohydrolase / phosphoribosyl-ATP pyrophosphohydrolase